MLINRKNFCFTQIPDKTNESKNPVLGSFLTIFGHVCQMMIFSKTFGSVTHNYILAPSTILSLRKKLMSQVQESLWTVRRMDGRTDSVLQDPFGQGQGSKYDKQIDKQQLHRQNKTNQQDRQYSYLHEKLKLNLVPDQKYHNISQKVIDKRV